jgi:thiamine-monophosphate kinase
VPLSAAYRAVLRDDPALALSGGEDYELLFCLRRAVAASALTRSLGMRVSHVGRITSSGKAVLVNAPDSIGRGGAPLLAGWDQLRSRPGG